MCGSQEEGGEGLSRLFLHHVTSLGPFFISMQELGWTLFLMLVKGHIPRLSLGVTGHLLPLMQVNPTKFDGPRCLIL